MSLSNALKSILNYLFMLYIYIVSFLSALKRPYPRYIRSLMLLFVPNCYLLLQYPSIFHILDPHPAHGQLSVIINTTQSEVKSNGNRK